MNLFPIERTFQKTGIFRQDIYVKSFILNKYDQIKHVPSMSNFNRILMKCLPSMIFHCYFTLNNTKNSISAPFIIDISADSYGPF